MLLALSRFYLAVVFSVIITETRVDGSFFFFFQAEDGIRDHCVTGVQTCALPISVYPAAWLRAAAHALAREEELSDPRRDQWQCYSGGMTRLAAIGLLERPFVKDRKSVV